MIKAYALALAVSTNTAVSTDDQVALTSPAVKNDVVKIVTQQPTLELRKRTAISRTKLKVRN